MSPSQYDHFSAAFAKSRDGMDWPEVEYILSKYADCFWQTSTVVDIGCWSGRLFPYLSHWKYVGIDSSAWLLQEARVRYPDVDFRKGEMQDVLELVWIGNTINTAIFLASFHHLRTESERRRTLEGLRSIMRPDGRIFMTNWNLLSEENLSKYESRRISGTNDFNIPFGGNERLYHAFQLEELNGLFLECGYVVLENVIYGNGRNIVSVLWLPDII